MIKEIKYPYIELTDLERDYVETFLGYYLTTYDKIHVYYVTDLQLGAGYTIVLSLKEIKSVSDIKFDDATKDITDYEHLVDNY